MYKRSNHFMDFNIAGFTYYDGLYVVQQMKVGDKIELQLEGENPFDPEAIALYYKGRMVGYVPRHNNSTISQLLYFGHDVFEAIISQLNLEGHPESQVRVAIRLKDVHQTNCKK